MKTNIIKACALGLPVFAFALTVSAAGMWTAPTQSAPQGNTDAPVNIGYSAQAKPGWLEPAQEQCWPDRQHLEPDPQFPGLR